jgi:hypothetical protein
MFHAPTQNSKQSSWSMRARYNAPPDVTDVPRSSAKRADINRVHPQLGNRKALELPRSAELRTISNMLRGTRLGSAYREPWHYLWFIWTWLIILSIRNSKYARAHQRC